MVRVTIKKEKEGGKSAEGDKGFDSPVNEVFTDSLYTADPKPLEDGKLVIKNVTSVHAIPKDREGFPPSANPKPLPKVRNKKTRIITDYERFILHNLDMLKEALDESIKQYQNKSNSKSKRRVVRYNEIYNNLIKIEGKVK